MREFEAPYYFKKLRSKYILLMLGEISLWSLSAGIVLYAITSSTTFNQSAWIVAVLGFIVTFLAGYRALKLNSIKNENILRYLHERFPQLEESADLLLKEPGSLTLLEQLQRERTTRAFSEIYPGIKLPHHLGRAAVIFIGSLALGVVLTSFISKQKDVVKKSLSKSQTEQKQAVKKIPASINKFSVMVTPPSYTGIPSSTSSNPELSLPEGSKAEWTLTFSAPILKASLILPAGDTGTLIRSKEQYKANKTFNESGFYQIQWVNESNEIKTSDYYKIQVIRDQAPEISIPDLPQSTVLTVTDNLVIGVASTISDDYRIKDAYIIATVSKGSGESVKFREEKLNFTSPAKIDGKHIRASRSIDLKKLGLEPGDELYFYAEAIDNRQPIVNRSRTETYFLALQDTATENLSLDAGLGVDLMPEYFRSQRQIIIDTEKLLKDKKKISSHAFKSTSNELGYDQKVLRLKYGEFLGEEFETQIGPIESSIEGQADAEAQDITKQYGHVHDKDNEHNLVEEKKQGAKADHHDHGINPEASAEKQESPADAYRHNHDDAEEATFFNQSIRSKLKAALTEMWDAELYLRLYQPEKSLPYQYKALKLLKEVSNDSRIYVHKTGFDPPPLKEEKRLTGDLTEIKNSKAEAQHQKDLSYPGIRKALARVELLIQVKSSSLTNRDKQLLLSAGNELAALALKQPGRYLDALSKIKTLNEEQLNEHEFSNALKIVQRSLWNALPAEAISPAQRQQTVHVLDKAFLKNIDGLK